MKYAVVLGLFSLLGLFLFAPKELGQFNPDQEDWVSLLMEKIYQPGILKLQIAL